MTAHLRPALVLVVLFTLLTGIALPLAFTGAAQAVLPFQANGSLLRRQGAIVGSALIGQNVTTARYFHPRPSATTPPYNAASSGASNLGPTSKALIDRVKAALAKSAPAPVPADMVTTSASGLDPDISPENAQRQVARVAAARGIAPSRLRALVAVHVTPRLFGLLGQPRVNVLRLNLALDAAFPP